MTSDDYLTHDPEIRNALSLVDDGSTFFDETLAALPDVQLDGPSLLPSWTRRHVIAHVAYNAQALKRLLEWASTGDEQRMYESPEARDAQIDEGARLPDRELRTLHRESADALEGAWRELSDVAWHAQVRTSEGPPFPATRTVWMRTREVWLHAVDLDSGATFGDLPPNLIDHLLADVLSTWRGRRSSTALPNFVLSPTDRGVPKGVGAPDDPDAIILRGLAADLARWATGRSFLGVTAAAGGAVPTAPRWI